MWCIHITIIVPSPWCHRQVFAVKNELIYVWVYYIKIYDPIKFSSNLWVFPGAINTCSHYERQVTSDRKNERNVSSYIIYTIFCWRYIYSYSFSLSFFTHIPKFVLLLLFLFLSLSLLILSFVSYSSRFYWNEYAAVAWRRISSRLWHSDKNEAISFFFQLHLCVYA